MKVAVVTPHYKEPSDWFQQCLDSVRDQTYPCTHIIVNDGADRGPEPSERVQVMDMSRPHGTLGNAARALGSVSAAAQEFDAIAWLDADNWFAPNHVESLVDLHRQSGAAVVTSGRYLHCLDGSELGPCVETDGQTHADASTFLITKQAYPLISVWYLMEPKYHPIGDRVVWQRVLDWGYSRAYSGLPTLRYRTPFKVHYDYYGVEVPEGAKEVRIIR